MDKDIDSMLFDRFRHIGKFIRMSKPPKIIMQEKCQKENVPPPSMKREMILIIISDCNGRLRQKELAEQFHISPSTLSEMLNRLESDGYIKRETDSSDRRATLLTLTQAGISRADEIKKEHSKMFAYLFRRLDKGEKEQLIHLIDKLLSNEESSQSLP